MFKIKCIIPLDNLWAVDNVDLVRKQANLSLQEPFPAHWKFFGHLSVRPTLWTNIHRKRAVEIVGQLNAS